MYSKILVPIHLGEAGKAKLMLDAARQLADAGAAIVLVNVVEEVPAYVAAELPRGLMESSREEAVRRLEELAGREGFAIEAFGTAYDAVRGPRCLYDAKMERLKA